MEISSCVDICLCCSYCMTQFLERHEHVQFPDSESTKCPSNDTTNVQLGEPMSLLRLLTGVL